MTHDELALAVEALLVARNPRGMQQLRAVLGAGYTLRAARTLSSAGTVIIGTGFPVANTFETDGPLGSIALYRALERLGSTCHIACARPLAAVLESDFRVIELEGFDLPSGHEEAQRNLARYVPDAVISIERPGLAADGRYYNMRGEDITPACAVFDYYLELAPCPTIAIGDGGNEIGMGRIGEALAGLAIRGAATSCDELVVADVSNWGAYGLITLMEALSGESLLSAVDHRATLTRLSEQGSVDGVTRENTMTEDGLPVEAGEALLGELAALLSASAAPAG